MDNPNTLPGTAQKKRPASLNKLIGLVMAAAALLLLGLFLFLPGKQGGVASMNDVAAHVPQDALALVTLTNLDRIGDRLSGSPLAEFLGKENMRGVLADFGAPEDAARAYGQAYDDVVALANNPAFRAIFGDDMSLALLPPDTGLLQTAPGEALRRSFVIYATTKAAPFAELVGKMASGVKLMKETAQNLILTRIEVQNSGQVFYGYNADGVVLLSADKNAVLAGAQAQNGATLDALPSWKEAGAFWKEGKFATPYFQGYYNLAALTALMPKLAGATAGAGAKEADAQTLQKTWQDTASYFQGMDYAYDQGGETQRGIESRGRMRVRYDALHALYKGAVDDAATSRPPLGLIDADTIFFEWDGCFNLSRILQEAVTAISQDDYRGLQEWSRANLGLEVEGAAAAFGPGLGILLNGIMETPLFPLPELTLFAGVRDRATVENLAGTLNQLAGRYGLTAQTRQAASFHIKSWPLMSELGLAPTLGLDERLVFLSPMQDAAQPFLIQPEEMPKTPEALQQSLGKDWGERLEGATSIYLFRPAQMASQAPPLIAFAQQSLGRKTTLGPALVKLMRSGEVAAATAKLGREFFDFNMILVPRQQAASSDSGAH